ncbi:MAG: EamA family transporter [Planctomycetes bacterium]|nr:EamA family transporter [Planctomycetota bacterium]
MSPSLGNRNALGGVAFCLLSALGYTASNICMRQLTAVHCDTFWAVFNRELVAPVFIGTWLLWQAVRGRRWLPAGRELGLLLLVGLLIQVAGNVCVQWSLGVVGLAVTIPAMFGAMITGGAVIGRVWLGERVSGRSITAVAMLLGSLALLGVGAEAAGRSIAEAEAVTPNPLLMVLAVAAAGLAGAVYALLSAVIRRSVTGNTSPAAVAFLVTLTGVVGLGPVCVFRLGAAALLETPVEQFILMIAAGVFNLVAFLALIHGLQRTTVVHANAVNASQVAMAAVAGMALFAEPPTVWLLLGVCLTIFGIVWIDRPAEAVDEIPPP